MTSSPYSAPSPHSNLPGSAHRFHPVRVPDTKVFKLRLLALGPPDAVATIDLEGNNGGDPELHTLPHTIDAMLAASAANPKTARALMRHSTIDLTMNGYTHTFTEQRTTAVNKDVKTTMI